MNLILPTIEKGGEKLPKENQVLFLSTPEFGCAFFFSRPPVDMPTLQSQQS